MITLENDRLTFRFPAVHKHAICSIDLQRTLRIPDDGANYPLPPGLGRFPLRHLDDYAGRLPPESLKRGGVIMPMHQSEALWIRFGTNLNTEGMLQVIREACEAAGAEYGSLKSITW